jgi:hypothetical protein
VVVAGLLRGFLAAEVGLLRGFLAAAVAHLQECRVVVEELQA